jgi:uncharacterized OB-fold protein
MRVKAVWKKAADRTGNVLDCEYFRPLKKREKSGGTPVRIKPVELDAETAQAFPGRIPMSYLYTQGTGGTKFYGDLAKGKLTGTYCKHCDAVHVPASGFCEFGMISLDPVKDAKTVNPKHGIVTGATAVYEDRSGKELAKPKVIVQVAFPNVMGTVFGFLDIKDPDDAEIGMDVVLVKTNPKAKTKGAEGVVFKPA